MRFDGFCRMVKATILNFDMGINVSWDKNIYIYRVQRVPKGTFMDRSGRGKLEF